MGKARILQAHGEGRYTIEIIEARERAESAKRQAEARIQTLNAEVNQLDAKIQAAQQAVDQAALEQNAAIEQWQQEVAEQGGSSVDLDAFARKLLGAAGKRDALRTEKRSKELRIAADQALVARINALPPLRQMQAWCADYTEDLSDVVATAEVPGELASVIIKPGFENANQWSATADGAIQPALAGTPASVFYNLAMTPGWQKWRPIYRTATITSIDGDTCSITLDAAASSQQGLSVNAQSSYSNVPILYMDCNGAVFEQGDRVLVAFAGNVEGPTVVGFEKAPRECNTTFGIYGPEGPVTNISFTPMGLTLKISKDITLRSVRAGMNKVMTSSVGYVAIYRCSGFNRPVALLWSERIVGPINEFAIEPGVTLKAGENIMFVMMGLELGQNIGANPGVPPLPSWASEMMPDGDGGLNLYGGELKTDPDAKWYPSYLLGKNMELWGASYYPNYNFSPDPLQ